MRGSLRTLKSLGEAFCLSKRTINRLRGVNQSTLVLDQWILAPRCEAETVLQGFNMVAVNEIASHLKIGQAGKFISRRGNGKTLKSEDKEDLNLPLDTFESMPFTQKYIYEGEGASIQHATTISTLHKAPACGTAPSHLKHLGKTCPGGCIRGAAGEVQSLINLLPAAFMIFASSISLLYSSRNVPGRH